MHARTLCVALALAVGVVTGGPAVPASPAPARAGGGSPATVVLTEPVTSTVTVVKSGTGAGTVLATGITCGDDCVESYATGTLVRLMAYPTKGSTFEGWVGCDYTASTECVVTASSDRVVEARIAPTGEATTEITSSRVRSAKRKATFEFTGSSPLGEVTFECRMDGRRFTACTSPRTFGRLRPGSHTFRVRAVDSNGADPTPARTTFVIRR